MKRQSFTRMWKGVKDLWKVLKPKDSLPSARKKVDEVDLVQ